MIEDSEKRRENIGLDYIYVTANPSRSVMHIGDGDDNILCGCDEYTDNTVQKSLDVIPVGYYDWCSRCVNTVLEDT